MTAPPQTVYLVRSNRPCSGASPSALGRRLRFGYTFRAKPEVDGSLGFWATSENSVTAKFVEFHF